MKVKKDYLSIFLLSTLSILLVTFSDLSKKGAIKGLNLCQGIIIPSLLPLLIMFNLILYSNSGRIIENFMSPLVTKIFKLPKCTSTSIIFGLIGGYPTGAILTNNLYKNDEIDKETGKRLLRFNINGGVAFIITAVGTIILKNKKAGVILYFSTTLASIIIALFDSIRYPKIKDKLPTFISLPFAQALNTSVENSLKAVLKMSCYIILFSSFNEIISFPKILTPFLEITNGITLLNNEINLETISFFLSFAGFCIHLQIFSIIKEFDMKYSEFLFYRIIHSFLSFFICHFLLKIFPLDITVFSNISEINYNFSYLNSSLSILMILGCGVLILDIEDKKRRC